MAVVDAGQEPYGRPNEVDAGRRGCCSLLLHHIDARATMIP
jgi:hypothetical protein